jgi:ubiquinone/menaquinone biosynthesis C-methylase UbiE
MSAQPNFNRVARVYRWAEYLTLGPVLQRTRTHFLPQLTGCRKAMLYGDGDGRFLARLLRQNPTLHATAVDISATMLHLLRERCAAAGSRLRALQTSALEAPIAPGTDLIVTHFFLDCLTQTEVDILAENVARNTGTGALWLVSDFQVPQRAFIRPIAKLYIRSLYAAFHMLTGLRVQSLPNPQAALEQAGFAHIAHSEALFGLIYTEIWQRR